MEFLQRSDQNPQKGNKRDIDINDDEDGNEDTTSETYAINF